MLRVFTISFMVLLALGASSCGHTPKNRSGSSAHIPYNMECTTPTDPRCVGQAGAMIQIPLGTGTVKALTGQCEMFVEDENSPRPCEGVKLVFRSAREGEERAAQIKGFNFKIEDLSEDTYNVQASSPKYDLETETKDSIANPSGQNLKIRVRAKARP